MSFADDSFQCALLLAKLHFNFYIQDHEWFHNIFKCEHPKVYPRKNFLAEKEDGYEQTTTTLSAQNCYILVCSLIELKVYQEAQIHFQITPLRFGIISSRLFL